MACDMTYYRHLRASSESVFQSIGLDNEVIYTSDIGVAEQVRDTAVNESVATDSVEN